MSKILLGIVLFVIVTVALFFTIHHRSDKAFLSSLKGEVVFVQRDKGILNVYIISANGTNKRVLDTHGSNALFPHWDDNKTNIHFYTLNGEIWQEKIIAPSGELLATLGNDASESLISRDVRAEDLVVERGCVYVKNPNKNRTLIYQHSNYDNKFNTGASEVSWSPDKRYIIFQSCSSFRGCQIFIADKTGEHVVKLTDGEMPDWR